MIAMAIANGIAVAIFWRPMDWMKLIDELEAAGFRQTEIAEKCGCSQAYVSQLKSGARLSPAFEIGSAIAALHESRHDATARRGSAA